MRTSLGFVIHFLPAIIAKKQGFLFQFYADLDWPTLSPLLAEPFIGQESHFTDSPQLSGLFDESGLVSVLPEDCVPEPCVLTLPLSVT